VELAVGDALGDEKHAAERRRRQRDIGLSMPGTSLNPLHVTRATDAAAEAAFDCSACLDEAGCAPAPALQRGPEISTLKTLA
jgi:hypothetical protein